MGHSTATQVRETDGTPILTLLYPPWPVTFVAAPVRAYTLAGQPRRASTYSVTLPYRYLPSALLAQLWTIPTDRATDWLLPIPGLAGNELTYGWVRGHFLRPEGGLISWQRTAWRGAEFQLTGASVL